MAVYNPYAGITAAQAAGMRKAQAIRNAKKEPVKKQASAPKVAPTTYSGGGYSTASVVATPAPPPRISDDEWLKGDSQYNAALAALEQKLRDFEVENASQRSKGIQDYDNSLLRLGWMKPAEDGAEGTWNQEDRTTAYGNAYQSLMGDYASRGLLQSTLYDQSRNDLLGNFTRQKTEMDTSHTNFLEELARALSGKKTDTKLGKDQARVEALARRAALESGVG